MTGGGRPWMLRVVALFVAAVLAATVGVVTVGAPSAAASTSDPASLPVVMVHGYDASVCPAGHVENWTWLDTMLTSAGWTGDRLPVSFYACDSDGVDIAGYGPDSPSLPGTAITAGLAPGGYWQDTGITTLAHDLAWFVYRNFTVHGQPIDLVASSMGGLIVRAALDRVSSGDPAFPPTLQVAQAITLSTPHLGYRTLAVNRADPSCADSVACLDMSADSEFMTTLLRPGAGTQGTGGTAWTVLGSSAGCDIVSAASALGMDDALRVDFAAPCYTHAGYLWDTTTDAAATARITTGSSLAPAVVVTTARHSLAFTVDRLLHPGTVDEPAPETTTPAATTPTPETTAPAPETTTPTPETTAPAPQTSSQPVVVVPVVPTTPVVQALPVFTVGETATVRYASTGATGYELRYRRALGTGAFGPAVYPGAWAHRTGTSTTFAVAAGSQYCVSVRAHGSSAAASAWSAETCTAVAFDDRALTRTGWTDLPSSTSYRSTVSRAQRTSAIASVRVSPRRIALVVTTCRGCGSVAVDIDGRPWRTVSTDAATSVRRVVLTQPARAGAPPARVSVRTTSARPVYLDGLAAASF